MTNFNRLRHPRGFTLVELLIVVAVIVLLVSMLMPSLQQAKMVARKQQCAANLHHIGQAYNSRVADEKIKSLSSFQAPGWTGSLQTYVGDQLEVFKCPEDEEQAGDEGAALEDYFLEVFKGQLDNPDDHAWDMPLEPSLYVRKLSQKQFGSFEKSNHKQWMRDNYDGYQPDSEDHIYWLCMEDQGHHGGGDMDFWDVVFRITHEPDKTLIYVKNGSAGYNFNLKRGIEREMIVHNVKKNEGATVEVPGGSTASYGMNHIAGQLRAGGRKILAIDYERTLVYGTDTDASRPIDDWSDEKWEDDHGKLRFARHWGQINTLYADGSVQLHSPDEIDPIVKDTRDDFWNP
ncbi:MAG: type II secretion system protein [Phycisphaerae bacterium]